LFIRVEVFIILDYLFLLFLMKRWILFIRVEVFIILFINYLLKEE